VKFRPDLVVSLTHSGRAEDNEMFASHAFDLILRTLTKAGVSVFVVDPGYSNHMSMIRHPSFVAFCMQCSDAGPVLTVPVSQARSFPTAAGSGAPS